MDSGAGPPVCILYCQRAAKIKKVSRRQWDTFSNAYVFASTTPTSSPFVGEMGAPR
ncbi:hypothetical protein M493_02512 [Geobacillus genomosp. 3]|uniref:Uncharacterized protein n=1 Tax=Geobacillus genomosp. 3 TaxID=1921421 RepID=V5LVP3_GEOG3|nr:hypothetical protein M493_02512 [Geobacillus genomosp. 3]